MWYKFAVQSLDYNVDWSKPDAYKSLIPQTVSETPKQILNLSKDMRAFLTNKNPHDMAESDFLKIAQDFGFIVTRGTNHYKLRNPQDGSLFVVGTKHGPSGRPSVHYKSVVEFKKILRGIYPELF